MTTKVKKTKSMMLAEHEAMEAQLDAEFAVNVQSKMLEAVVLAAKLERSSLDAGWGELSENRPQTHLEVDGDETFTLLVSASHAYNREWGPANFTFSTKMSRQKFEDNLWAMARLKETYDLVAEKAKKASAKMAALAKLSPEDRKALGL